MQTACNPANDTRTITVSATDDRGITAVVLRWSHQNGSSGQRAMTRSGSTWTAAIGPFADTAAGHVTYRAVATDTNGATASSPSATVHVEPCPG